MSCDCLVCGVNDTKIQQRLLAKLWPLTLKRGFDVPQAIEIVAEQNTNDLVVAQEHNFVFCVQKAVNMTHSPIFKPGTRGFQPHMPGFLKLLWFAHLYVCVYVYICMCVRPRGH